MKFIPLFLITKLANATTQKMATNYNIFESHMHPNKFHFIFSKPFPSFYINIYTLKLSCRVVSSNYFDKFMKENTKKYC